MINNQTALLPWATDILPLVPIIYIFVSSYDILCTRFTYFYFFPAAYSHLSYDQNSMLRSHDNIWTLSITNTSTDENHVMQLKAPSNFKISQLLFFCQTTTVFKCQKQTSPYSSSLFIMSKLQSHTTNRWITHTNTHITAN